MREKYLTFLIVPHDEHNVWRARLSYMRVRIVGAIVAVAILLVLVAIVSYGRVAARASRAVFLERENARLVAENAKVESIAANLARTEAAYDQIRSMAGFSSESGQAAPTGVTGDGARPSGWPLAKKGFLTAGFEGREGHAGVDIAIPTRTAVLATAAGVVAESGVDDVLGEFVVLRHGEEYETVYGHNASRVVSVGASVERGETIAYSGNSGASSAPHLHYEIRHEGSPVDPAPFME